MSSTSNVFTNEPDFTLPDGVSIVQVAKRAGAELLGGTVYAMEPGSRWADLHVHHANEEMIVVLDGAPTLHTLDGARELHVGDVVACLRGRRGAHRLTNDSEAPARVLILSTMNMPEIVEYPDEGEDGRVLAMTEPPWSEAPYDDSKGRLIRVFRRNQGKPVPPDAAPGQSSEQSTRRPLSACASAREYTLSTAGISLVTRLATVSWASVRECPLSG